MAHESARIAQIDMQLDINGSASQVWKALTENIGDWWPADFYAGGDAATRRFSLEAWPGGRMLESWGEEGGVLWGTVVAIEPNARLSVLGAVFPGWGGPSQWFGTWQLTASGAVTQLTYSESSIGRLSDAGLADKDKGWRFLWATLKAHVEGESPPAWSD